MKKLSWTLFGVVVLGGITASPSSAALIAAIDINGNPAACAVDNNASACAFGTQIQDIDPAVGVLSYGNVPLNLGGVLLVTGSSQQATVGPPQNILNTSSAQLTNLTSNPLTVRLAVSATNFTPPVSQAFASGSATWQNAIGGAITMGWYNDPANAQGAETATDTPGTLLLTCFDSITLPADSTSCSGGPFNVSDLNPFSMTLFTSLTLPGGATVVNRGQTEIKPVPEPASLLLLGLGLVGLGYFGRR